MDWSYASAGPAAVDIAHLRWNLAVSHGLETADRLLAHPDHHPYWDVVDVLDLLTNPDPPAPQDVPALEAVLAVAL